MFFTPNKDNYSWKMAELKAFRSTLIIGTTIDILFSICLFSKLSHSGGVMFNNKTSRYSITSFIFLFISVPISLAAQDISIWDFRIPETKYQRLTGSLSGGWNKTSSDDYSLNYHYSNSGINSNYNLALLYNFANYNEDNSLEITAQMTGRTYHQSSETASHIQIGLVKVQIRLRIMDWIYRRPFGTQNI
jgi:hypothetical protein